MSVPGGQATRKRVRLDYDERRTMILTAARHLFCSRPYADVSMNDLANEAGVARGLLHHYFGSKRDLYLEVVRDVVAVATLPFPDWVDDLPPARVWEASVDAWMDLIESNRELWLTASGAGGTGRDPELQAILDEAGEAVAGNAIKALGLDHGDVPPELRAMVRGFGGFAEEITREWLERRRLTREQARTLLLGSLPLMVERLLPDVLGP